MRQAQSGTSTDTDADVDAFELLPISQAASIRDSLLDYLGTTFALADPDARYALEEFLQHPETGLFRDHMCVSACRSVPPIQDGATVWSGTRDSHPTAIRRRPLTG